MAYDQIKDFCHAKGVEGGNEWSVLIFKENVLLEAEKKRPHREAKDKYRVVLEHQRTSVMAFPPGREPTASRM